MNPLSHPRINIDPTRRFGRPTLGTTRTSVADVLGCLASGESIAGLIRSYPASRRTDAKADICAALQFAQALVNEIYGHQDDNEHLQPIQ